MDMHMRVNLVADDRALREGTMAENNINAESPTKR